VSALGTSEQLVDLISRLVSRSTLTPGECWIWHGWTNHKGYGQTSYHGQNVFIHRKIYELMHGVLLTTEQFVCHTCDQRSCWNPAHLFLGDAKVNNNDCAAKGRHHNATKVRCKYGHDYTEENTVWKTGKAGNRMRGCKTCIDIGHRKESYIQWRREYQRRRRAEKRAKKNGGES
jgi:hypothetical protein